MNPKMLPQALIGSIILVIILSLATTGSIFPWQMLVHPKLIIKILGWYLLIQIFLTTIALIAFKFAIPDKECPICHKDIKTYMPVYGQPVMCYRCHTMTHKNCLLSKNKRCPICYPEENEAEIIHDYTSGLPRSNNYY